MLQCRQQHPNVSYRSCDCHWKKTYRLACDYAMSELMIDLLIQKDQADHRPAQAPLICAVFKQDKLKQGGQDLWQ